MNFLTLKSILRINGYRQNRLPAGCTCEVRIIFNLHWSPICYFKVDLKINIVDQWTPGESPSSRLYLRGKKHIQFALVPQSAILRLTLKSILRINEYRQNHLQAGCTFEVRNIFNLHWSPICYFKVDLKIYIVDLWIPAESPSSMLYLRGKKHIQFALVPNPLF